MDPISGIAMYANSYLQMNVMLEALPDMPDPYDPSATHTWFANIRNGTIAPLFWAQQSVGAASLSLPTQLAAVALTGGDQRRGRGEVCERCLRRALPRRPGPLR